MVDVKGWYNVLLERDWIHTNECILWTLHRCLVQWEGTEWKQWELMRLSVLQWPNPRLTFRAGS
jgi:hypothetical protein